ncbi:MAG: argininosuccinate lyase [Syntrophobacterales bacterium]|jgi:argininosuccinate lyase|nr:argininosuccinate lyase [Syntrophobacterales bacterium]
MKAWGGRFKKETNPLMERYSASIDFDWALFEYDIEGSKAHAEMLREIGVLSGGERDAILTALDEIKAEIREGTFLFSASMEDIHMHIEARLIEKTGDAGKKLHTGRSRNDQVALDMRLFLRAEMARVDEILVGLLKALINKGEKGNGVFMPGYTHMQKAQVVPFAHYLLAYYYMLKRDRERLKGVMHAVDVLPLGSGALAGSTIPLDREFVRERLGFSRVSENSMDTVADRDFIVDAIYVFAMIMMHLSRLSEDLIIFSTEEFGYVSLPDELCTGSSLMPHKKNPDALELTRGKASKVMADLFALLSLLKGLPMTYNRDLQEDKEPLFHAVDTVKDALSIMTLCVEGMEVKVARMEAAVAGSYMSAVEMAEYLTMKGVPFREAHSIVGRLVRDCEENGTALSAMNIEDMKTYSGAFDSDIFDHIDPRRILSNRRTAGAASFSEVEKELNAEKRYLNSDY